MMPWNYFHRPTNMAFHDLTTTIPPPKNLRSLLGLSLKFIPNPRYNVPWDHYHDTTIPRLVQSLKVKIFFATQWANNDDNNDADYNPRMYSPTGWVPPEKLSPFPKELHWRLQQFQTLLKTMVKRQKSRSNLLRPQRLSLNYLRSQEHLLVVQCDKNLGPALIERDKYVQLVLRDHLSDDRTYQRLTTQEATSSANRIQLLLQNWMTKHKKDLTKNERKFMADKLKSNVTPFATFYATMKVHKSPLKTRPIVSCSGSLLEALGIWVDDKLQIAAKQQRSYFKSSFDLKRELLSLNLPANASLFTADAQSMYTNIPTDRAIHFIAKHLRQTEYPGIPTKALIEALTIVMKNNIFTFGDTTWQQKTGTAMGTPPAPPWATLYFALCEEIFLPLFGGNLLLYRRFIDDILGIWLADADPVTDLANWTKFQEAVNNPIFALTWDFSDRCQAIDFMDLHLSIKDNQIQTTLYEKPTNLHLYIPPASCHPPGLLRGIVFGLVLRIFTLCSDRDDTKFRVEQFFHQLQRRGYHRNHILPLFQEAILRAESYTGDTPPTAADRRRIRQSLIFHIPYHPQNPPSRAIQSAWHSSVANPAYGRPLSQIKNSSGTEIGLDQLIIAYTRPPNLGNLLSYRKLKNTSGPPVSSFFND